MTFSDDHRDLRVLPRPVAEADHLDISILLNTVFESSVEVRLVDRLRQTGAMAMELVAEDEQGIFGYVAFARMSAPDGYWLLGPLAIRQSYQGHGLGSRLLLRALDEARKLHPRALLAVGAQDYYTRFGFSRKAAENLEVPYSVDQTLLFPIAAGTGGAPGRLVFPDAYEPD